MTLDANTYYLNQHLDKEDEYTSWLENNEQNIVEAYIDSIEELDDVPEGFIETYYENSREEF